MTRFELDKKFKKAGWMIIHGKAHDLAISPNGQKVALPRHKGGYYEIYLSCCFFRR